MLVNTLKTNARLMTTWQKLSKLTEMKDLDIYFVYLKVDKIKNFENEKIVGVIDNQNVLWENHINKKTNKTVNRLLSLLWRIKKYLPLATRKLYFDSYILPHLDYCSAIWGASPHIQKLVIFQKRAARFILDSKCQVSYHGKTIDFESYQPTRNRLCTGYVSYVPYSLQPITFANRAHLQNPPPLINKKEIPEAFCYVWGRIKHYISLN